MFSNLKAHAAFFWRTFFCCLTTALVLCTFLGSEKADALYILTGTDDTALVLDDSADTAGFSSRLITIGGSSANPEVILNDGTMVSISYNGASVSAASRQETVTSLLNRMHIEPGPLDMIAVDLSAPVMRITVASDLTFYEKIEAEKPFETVRVANPAMAKGTETVTQEGRSGTVTATYEVIYANGQEISRQLVEESGDTSVDQVVEYGTAVTSVDRSDRIARVNAGSDGSGYLTFASGATMPYEKVITCSATAYTSGHDGVGTRTSTGTTVRHGTVAVDPNTIPYGTKMYIVSSDGSVVYGTAVAEDTGGAIRGNRLDLYYETYNECIQFGRRNCTVYVLG
ncbi:G5 domain-containing protein [Oscillibacter sp. MSJ-2]|uniref:G5 domain-containing protein n=1 Tax=Dysosmobacter acutus TaxID=2841504 RepID=A0ABS6FCS5_9FIRM|nr:3D domain-containing protein [Dysosmobacter acutus]MBU5627367.1 G5 domain-containing protein [Dysosmobacter acutus]